MAKSNEEKLDDAVIALVHAAHACSGPGLQGIEVDFQPTGEYPYRMQTENETLPLVGVGRDGSPPGNMPDPNASVAVSGTEKN